MGPIFARKSLPYRKIEQFGILHQGSRPAYLNETGTQLWDLIDGRSTPAQITNAFADRRQASSDIRPKINDSVSAFLSYLRSRDLVYEVGATGAGEYRPETVREAAKAPKNPDMAPIVHTVQEQCMTPRAGSGSKSLKDEIDRLYWRRHYIQKMHVELTYRCNFRCVHCYNTTHVGGKSELTTAEWGRTLDQLAGLGCSLLIFTGGEVFVRKDIVDILKMACEKGFSFRLNTNGSLIDEKMIEILEPMRPFLQSADISFYGATPEIHDMLARRPGSYLNTLRGVKLLVQAGMRLSAKYVTMHGNFNGIKKFENDMRELGVPFIVHTGSVIPRTDRDSAPLVQLLTEKQYRTLIETRGDPTGGDSPGLCRPGHVRGAITPEGFVSPCEWLTDFKLGNLRDQSLESIWYGQEFKEFRKVFDDEDDCTPCELRPGCGRCPAHSYLETGNLLKCAPIQRRNAEIYHEYAHAAV